MNRLAHETSPYLLQHADNPVDWYPWGDEALERAREEDKPILLSIGYSACHWCHVMEHESFDDPATAAVMNELFVNIKVDREERPDLDGVYMEAVVAMTGHGGWPMTMFLTPECRPFYGGTYYPPEPRMNMPAFTDLLRAIARAYDERRAEVVDQAAKLVDALAASARQRPSADPLTSSLLTEGVSAIGAAFDSVHGGFGRAPKFPPASTIEFLLRMRRRGAPRALEMAELTLDRMAAGGMYDQIGGGFHRYSVDQVWLVPHFEKMLYDNALLASAYLHAWQVTGKPRYREVVEQTLDYLTRRMALPSGGLASAEDADTDGEEGLTYVWTPDEIRAVLDDAQAELVIRQFGVEPGGNFEGRSILHRPDGVPDAGDALAAAAAALLAARDERPQPFRDEKVLAGWNGLALGAFADAGSRLGRPDYVEAARGLAEFLLGTMSTEDGRLWRTALGRTARISAYLEDYANVAGGLLELYTATGEVRWIEEARRLALLAVDLFEDAENGGFFFTPRDGEELIVRKKELDDHPTPSGNSMMALVLLRLSRIYADTDLERLAVGVFRVGHEMLSRAPASLGHMLSALELHFSDPREIAIVGDLKDERTRALRQTAFSCFQPNTVFAYAEGLEDPASERVPLLAGKGLVDGRPAAYVCSNFACQTPITDAARLHDTLSEPSVRML
ncbi:MAG: thioredoxin domain-containing protein [Actinomycetia bacterium]|nr:thioredoxin domain-containing protein [Actinomycetes bacterium]